MDAGLGGGAGFGMGGSGGVNLDGGTCGANTMTDPNNCGACGVVCPGDAPLCEGGSCTGSGCPAGMEDDNGLYSFCLAPVPNLPAPPAPPPDTAVCPYGTYNGPPIQCTYTGGAQTADELVRSSCTPYNSIGDDGGAVSQHQTTCEFATVAWINPDQRFAAHPEGYYPTFPSACTPDGGAFVPVGGYTCKSVTTRGPSHGPQVINANGPCPANLASECNTLQIGYSPAWQPPAPSNQAVGGNAICCSPNPAGTCDVEFTNNGATVGPANIKCAPGYGAVVQNASGTVRFIQMRCTCVKGAQNSAPFPTPKPIDVDGD